jgi:hypothetical protein
MAFRESDGQRDPFFERRERGIELAEPPKRVGMRRQRATAGIEIQFGYPGAFPILLLGTAQVRTPYDAGFLLVSPAVVVPLPVSLSGSGSLLLASELPLDAGLCGASLYLQVLIPDPGAAGNQHLAMTPGLRLTLGS